MSQSRDEAAIRAKLAIYRKAWLGSDLQLFASLWDETYPRVTYMPMERAKILRDWPSIIEYWQTILPITKMERWEVVEIFIDFLSPELAWVFS
jgi:hypothetical protein